MRPARHFSLVGAITAAALVVTASTAAAAGQSPGQLDSGEVRDVMASVDAATAKVGTNALPTTAFGGAGDALTAPGGVTLEGDVLDLGNAGISISLPVDPNGQAAVAPDGSVVAASTNAGLQLQVEAVAGGTARVLTVADESYSDTPVHRYTYDIGLPPGAYLSADGDGSITILQDRAQADGAVSPAQIQAVDLAAVLPEVTDADRAAQAQAAAAAEGTGSGPVVIGAFTAPWSVDANGTQLPSRYEVSGDQLTQVVDTSGAAFPVVSDPLPLIAIGLLAAARALAPWAIRAFAVQTIRRGAAATINGGYRSFDAFKAAAGTKTNYQWHHLVEQSTVAKRGFDVRAINHPNNLIQIPKEVHQKCINSWMGKKNTSLAGITARGSDTMRDTVHRLSYSQQHAFGFDLLKHCGVPV